jgi:hypothetical protein
MSHKSRLVSLVIWDPISRLIPPMVVLNEPADEFDSAIYLFEGVEDRTPNTLLQFCCPFVSLS